MKKALFAALAALAIGGPATAAPIVYEGTLQNGVTVNGVNMQVAGNQNNPVGADYWQFQANAGSLVTVFGDRLAGHYDMAFWIHSGLYADTNDISFGGAGFIAFGDDQDPPNIGGPFGDPRSTFVAPVTGWYTVAVTNFLSNNQPPNPYALTATGVPEPMTLSLLGLGLAAAAVRRRRA